LRGIIYYADHHFTSVVVGPDGSMWFHDGMTTRKSCLLVGNMNNLDTPLSLHKFGGKSICAVIYT
ncbi:hypothetical protein DFH06DRAFT_912420, partial [Mycena polygramma]